MNDDNGFEFFNGDLQQQYFNYYLFSEMMNDDSYETPHQQTYRHDMYLPPPDSPQPFTQKYDDYLKNRTSQTRVDFSSVMFYIALAFYLALVIAAVFFI